MFVILFQISSASTSNNPSFFDMAELRSHCNDVPILFPINAHGFAVVSELHLCIRFSLQVDTVWVHREIFNPATGLLVHTFHESSKLNDNGNVVWELGAGKYRVGGWPDSRMGVSTEILPPVRSPAAAFNTPPVISVKTEPALDNIIDLSDSSTEGLPVQKNVVHDSPSLFPSDSYVSPLPSPSLHSSPSVPSMSRPPPPIVQCLRRLSSMPGSKNVLKKIDYYKI